MKLKRRICKNYDSHGIKLLATAVIKLAVDDLKEKRSVTKLRRGKALVFLQGKTEGPVEGESALENWCCIAGLDISAVQLKLFSERIAS